MKNLKLFVHPSHDFLPEHKITIKIQIDNMLRLGWKPEDIILATNFPYEYNGVKSLIVSDDNYNADVSPCAPIMNVIVELFERGLVKKNDVIWYHDEDVFQIDKVTESELNFGNADVGLIEWPNRQKISASSFFFKGTAKDIFNWVREVMYKYRADEELALSALYENNLLWVTGSQWKAQQKFVPLNHPGAENMRDRVKLLNITYDFEMNYLNQHYPLATKPIKTVHFHTTRDRLLDSAMYGRNSLHKPLMPEILIEIFHKHGIRGNYLKKMKNLMIYTSREKQDLVNKQIENSLKMGWKKEDIIVMQVDNANKADVIFQLLSDGVVKEAQLWWYHDLDVFQLAPMDSSQIDLEDTLAGFMDNGTGKIDTGSIFFRKDSDKIFEWTRNRARKFGGNESAALDSLVSENYHNINSKYVKLDVTKYEIFRRN